MNFAIKEYPRVSARRLEEPKVIPLSAPAIRGNEWKYVKECLDTGWVSSAGPFVERFEAEVCRFTGARHAVACVNGTAALHVALRLAGVQPGDEVIVPTLTFIAPVNAVHYLGASPVFMDCDRYYNLDAVKTAAFIHDHTTFKDGHTYNRVTWRKISALVPVHVFGNAAELEMLGLLCRERNIKVVEDATEGLGTVYSQGVHRGMHSGTIGDLGCFSFNGNKIITTGGGGMLVTNHTEYAEKARYLTTQAKDDEVHYVHHEVGYNYRLTNIQAALGVAQLEQLPEYLDIKLRNYLVYQSRLGGVPGLHLADAPPYARNNHWMYALQIDARRYGCSPSELMQRLTEQRIQSRPVWQLCHLQRPYRQAQTYRIDHAPRLHDATLNIPCSVGLEIQDVERIARVLNRD